MTAPAPARALVVGRYAGAVAVLADILRGSGVVVTGTAALDASGQAGVSLALADHGTAGDPVVVVVTLAPADDSARLVAALVPAGRTVLVTWHPPDERPPHPAAAVVVAGWIHRQLGDAVRTTWAAGVSSS